MKDFCEDVKKFGNKCRKRAARKMLSVDFDYPKVATLRKKNCKIKSAHSLMQTNTPQCVLNILEAKSLIWEKKDKKKKKLMQT